MFVPRTRPTRDTGTGEGQPPAAGGGGTPAAPAQPAAPAAVAPAAPAAPAPAAAPAAPVATAPAQPVVAPAAPAAPAIDWEAKAKEHEQAAKGHADQLAELRRLLDPNAAADVDPAKVAADAVKAREESDRKLDAANARAAAATRTSVATLAALESGANVAAVMDSVRVREALDALPVDATAEQIRGVVKAQVDATPSFRTSTTPPPPATTERTGGGEPPKGQLTRADLAKMSPREIETARKDGRLTSLLGGTAG